MIIKEFFDKKTAKKYVIFLIISVIMLTLGMIMLKYSVEGEKNLPFNLSKILVVSTADTVITKDEQNNLNAEIIARNDIYFHINKNGDYKKEAIIDKIIIDNFKILETPLKGETKIYFPSKKDNKYEYTTNYEIKNKLQYQGSERTDTELLEISNQGGVIGISTVLRNLGQYVPSKNEKIQSDGTLLNKANVSLNDIKEKISFDLTIATENGINFKANIVLDLPSGDIITNGVVTKDETKNIEIIFKRV